MIRFLRIHWTLKSTISTEKTEKTEKIPVPHSSAPGDGEMEEGDHIDAAERLSKKQRGVSRRG